MGQSVDHAYRTIRDGIVSGRYRQGSHITAQDLALASRLSRTPVREAMRRLQSEGLIRIIPNRGAFVASWSEPDIEQYFGLAIVLESYAAELAAKNATVEALERLRDLCHQMDSLVAQRAPSVSHIKEVNDAFHKAVVQVGGNARLDYYLSSMIETEVVFGTLSGYDEYELRRAAGQHNELVAAIEARDPTWARSVMSAHILSARHAMLRSIREHPLA
jgi:DNA-binding GntR family transcriptional regulator